MVKFDYIQGDTFFHKLDPKTKLLWLVTTTVLCLLSNNFYYLLAIFASVFILALALQLPFRKIFTFAKIFFILAGAVIILQGFLYPLGSQVLFSILGKAFTFEGLMFGLAIAFRLFTLAFAIPIFILTTKHKEMIESLSGYISERLAFLFTMVFRFIPIFQQEIQTISCAQQSRGLKKGIRWYFAIIVPLLAKGLAKAKYLALSAESRGFGLGQRKYVKKKLKPLDWGMICGLILLVFVLMWLRQSYK